MRVLHVIPSLDKRDGGPSIALPLMARGLAMQGVDVDVVATMSASDATSQAVAFAAPANREGCTVRFFKRQTGFYKLSLPLWRWLRAHVKDYSVVHNHALFSFAPLAGARAARRGGVPYIMRPLGLLNAWGMENRRRRIKNLSFRCLDRPALDHAAAIHYTSAQEEREGSRLGLRARSAVIPLGIDFAPFRNLPGPECFHERFPQVRGRRIILFLSRLDPKKGVELLLDAFASLGEPGDNAVLVVAGDGDADYKARLKMRVEALKIEDRVIWAGFLDGPDKLAALAAADLFVLPSYSENFGIALLEAMAAGLPCISSDQVALATEPGNETALCITPCRAEPLRHAMARLLDDDAERKTLAENARRVAGLRYSLEAMGASIAGLYRELIAERCARVQTQPPNA